MRNGYAIDANECFAIDQREVAMMVHDGDKLVIIFKGNAAPVHFPWEPGGQHILKGFTDWIKQPEN